MLSQYIGDWLFSYSYSHRHTLLFNTAAVKLLPYRLARLFGGVLDTVYVTVQLGGKEHELWNQRLGIWSRSCSYCCATLGRLISFSVPQKNGDNEVSRWYSGWGAALPLRLQFESQTWQFGTHARWASIHVCPRSQKKIEEKGLWGYPPPRNFLSLSL